MRVQTSAVATAMWLTLAGLGAAGSLLGGCAGEGAKTALGYTEDAKRAYDAAMESYNAHDWLEAQTRLREVKRKYSYSKYARLAELRIADADFEQEKYLGRHPRVQGLHPRAPLRRGRRRVRARAHRREHVLGDPRVGAGGRARGARPGERGRRVQGAQQLPRGLSGLEAVRARARAPRPGGRAPRAPRALCGPLLSREGQLRRGRRAHPVRSPQLRARRRGADAHGVTTDSDLEAEALLLLGKTYLKMHKWGDARQAFQSIVSSHGQSPLVIQARDYLQHLSEQGA